MKLRICEFNLENLFISMEYYRGEALAELSEAAWSKLALAQLRAKQKPLQKLFGLAKAIADIDADIFMLIEVGGKDSLENLNRHFLGDRYATYFVEGNSRRSIDLGFLVKKEFSYRVEALSNRETPIEVYTLKGKYTARFSRDVAELRLYDREKLSLILLLTHLKSKLGTETDYEGKDRRTAEAIALAELYRGLREKHPETAIVVGGDFNADLSSLELELVKRTDLTDFHDLIGTPNEDRSSLVFFDYSGVPRPMILDYLLVSPQLRDRVIASESFTYRYKGFYDLPEQLPANRRQREFQPSDHYPVVLTLSY